MYIRKWIPYTDREILIEMAIATFNVKRAKMNKILNRAHDVLVVVVGGQVAGFLCYRLYFQSAAFVDYLALDANHRGNGIFQKMVPLVIDSFRQKGIRGIYGLVSRTNPKALKKFIQLGCKPIRSLSRHRQILIQLLI